MVPKLSVIMPVYNTETYLPRSIESVLAQTFADFEFILVDDGSKDHSLDVCKKYAESDARIRVFHQENAGALAARLRGVKEARAERMIFIDSDDYIDPDMYERMYAEMETGVDLCFCDISFERMDGTKVKTYSCDGSTKRINRNELLTEFFNNNVLYLGYTWNVMMRRKLFEQVDFSNFRYSNREDTYENFLMIINCSEASYIHRPLYHYIFDRLGGVCNTQLNTGLITNMVEISHIFYGHIIEKMPEFEPAAFKSEYLANLDALIYATKRGSAERAWKVKTLEYCKMNYKRYVTLVRNPLFSKFKIQWLFRFPKSYVLVSNIRNKIKR